jgi:hypothetical protein
MRRLKIEVSPVYAVMHNQLAFHVNSAHYTQAKEVSASPVARRQGLPLRGLSIPMPMVGASNIALMR